MTQLKSWKTFGALVLGLALLTALLSGCATPAQAGGGTFSGTANLQTGAVVPNSIAVSGYGEASGTPDIAHITLGVSVTDPDVGKAVATNSDRMEQVKAALLGAGIAEEDIQTVGFSVWPEDKYNPQSGMPTGERTFHVDNQLNVKVRDLARAGEIIDVALEAGANSVYGLSFGVENADALENTARTNAIADARAKAQQIADALGVTLGDPIMISEGGAAMPPIVYPQMAADGAGMGGGAAVPVSPGQLTVSQSVSIVFSFTK